MQKQILRAFFRVRLYVKDFKGKNIEDLLRLLAVRLARDSFETKPVPHAVVYQQLRS